MRHLRDQHRAGEGKRKLDGAAGQPGVRRGDCLGEGGWHSARLLWPTVVAAAHFILFTAVGVISPYEALIAIVVVSTFNTIWIATGVAISLRFRKVTAAVIANLSLPIALYGALSLVLAVIDSLLSTTNGAILRLTTWYLPYFYLAGGIHGDRNYQTDIRRMPGTGDSVDLQTFAFVTVMVGGLHIMIAAGLLAWTARRLDRVVGRAPQLEPLEPLPALPVRA